MEEKFLTLPEAAQFLRLGRSRLYQLAETGEIPNVQLNGRGRILFKLSELEKALVPRIAKPQKGQRND